MGRSGLHQPSTRRQTLPCPRPSRSRGGCPRGRRRLAPFRCRTGWEHGRYAVPLLPPIVSGSRASPCGRSRTRKPADRTLDLSAGRRGGEPGARPAETRAEGLGYHWWPWSADSPFCVSGPTARAHAPRVRTPASAGRMHGPAPGPARVSAHATPGDHRVCPSTGRETGRPVPSSMSAEGGVATGTPPSSQPRLADHAARGPCAAAVSWVREAGRASESSVDGGGWACTRGASGEPPSRPGTPAGPGPSRPGRHPGRTRVPVRTHIPGPRWYLRTGDGRPRDAHHRVHRS
jgi:hypothetical protein